jgi:hypothetical protein
MLTGNPSKATFPGQSGYFGHLMLGYQLLDTLLWCSFWPCHPDLSHVKRRPPPVSLPKKLVTVVKSLGNWTDLILNAKIARKNQPLPAPSSVRTDVGSAEDVTYAIAVNNLKNSIVHYKTSHWHHILMNLHSVAFIVRRHSPVRSSVIFSFVT